MFDKPAMWVTNSGREIGPELMNALDRSPGYTVYQEPVKAYDADNVDLGTPVRIEVDTATGEAKVIEPPTFAGEGNPSDFNAEIFANHGINGNY